MTTVDERSSRRHRVLGYLVAGVVTGALLVAGSLLYHSARSDAEAGAKADQLIARLGQAGARVPAHDQVVRLLGTDGGTICVDPASALTRATSDSGISNGAGGPGARPVRSPATVVRGETFVVEIYCPGKLGAFQDYVRGLAFAGAVNR